MANESLIGGGPAAAPVADVTTNTVPDAEVTTVIDGSSYLDAKIAAMTAHATQITVDGDHFALSDRVRREVTSHECYTLLAGRPDGGAQAREQDLFAGIA